MLTENWKRLLDYKSECNVTKYRPNRASILLFWEVIKLFTLDLWQTTPVFTSKLDAYNTSMGNSKVNLSHTSCTLFPPNFISTQNMVWVIRGKNIYMQKWSEGKPQLPVLQVSRRFELSRVRVTEGKITVNVWRKSRGNWVWFELVRVSSQQESTVLPKINKIHHLVSQQIPNITIQSSGPSRFSPFLIFLFSCSLGQWARAQASQNSSK